MKDFEEFLKKVKQSGNNLLPKHEIRLPFPDREWAKKQGAKWDTELKSFVFYSDDPNQHVLKDYIKSSSLWIKIPNKLPYDEEGIMKQAGVVTEKENDQWVNYVLAIEKYEQVIQALDREGFL